MRIVRLALGSFIALISLGGADAEARCYTEQQCMTKTNSVPRWGFRCRQIGQYRSCSQVIVGYQRVYAGKTCWGTRTICTR